MLFLSTSNGHRELYWAVVKHLMLRPQAQGLHTHVVAGLEWRLGALVESQIDGESCWLHI